MKKGSMHTALYFVASCRTPDAFDWPSVSCYVIVSPMVELILLILLSLFIIGATIVFIAVYYWGPKGPPRRK